MNEDCTKYKDLLLDIETVRKELLLENEKLRGEIKSLNTRITVYEGLVNSTSSRIHTRLDDVNVNLQGLHEKQAANNVAQQQEIDKLKLHFRYIMGIAAGVAVVLNFAKKIKDLFFS